MKWFLNRKVRGAVTIFLIIITVPTMLFSAVLIDGSRMAGAKAITQGAADLAASSALADYQQELKDAYGLFAIDDTDKLEKVFKESLSATLLASGLEDKGYTEQIWEILKESVTGASGAYSSESFLNLYDFSVEKCQVTPMYSLANKEVLQSQMIEYAKYRGVYLMADRLEILSSLEEAKEQAEKNNETVEVMEDKVDIDEDNAAADRAFVELCSAIETLNNTVSGLRDTKEAYLNALGTEMERIWKCNVEDNTSSGGPAGAYVSAQDSLVSAAEQVVTAARNVQSKASSAQSEVNRAKSRLQSFISENSGKASDNEGIQSLIEEARTTASDYDQYYVPRITSILNDSVISRLASDSSLGTDLSGSVKSIESAVRKYEEELEEKREEDEDFETDEYLYYDLNSGDRSANSSSVIYGSYEPALSDRISYFADLSWDASNPMLEHLNAEPETTAIDESTVSDRSGGSGEEKVEEDAEDRRREVPEAVYQARPSASFSGDEHTVDADYYNASDKSDLSGVKNMLDTGGSIFLDVGETVRDEVLSLTYMFGTFKTRLTGQFAETPAVNQDYVPEWRYETEGGEMDMRFESMSDRETVLRSEIEYLIFGNRTDKANENSAYAVIYGERFINNMIALKLNGKVNSSCHAAAAASSAATMGTVPEPVFYWIFLTTWSVAETYLEMSYLIQYGYRIPLIKTKDNVLLTVSADSDGTGLISHYGDPDRGLFVCYEDYLLILLLTRSSEERIMRTADLIEMNMKTKDSDFTMASAYTYLSAETEISLNYLFGDLVPFRSDYEKGGATGRMRFKSSIYQGY